MRAPNLRKIGHFGFSRSVAREALLLMVINWLVAAAEKQMPSGRSIVDETIPQHE